MTTSDFSDYITPISITLYSGLVNTVSNGAFPLVRVENKNSGVYKPVVYVLICAYYI